MSVPVAFDYCAAKSIDEAIALVQQYGDDAEFLAGGQSLLPTMKLRLAQPEHLIDLGRIQGWCHDYLRYTSAFQCNQALLPHVTGGN